MIEEIPNDSAAALVLIEHHWAVPLRDAVARAGGFRLADGFISPLDLVEIGLVTAEEAEELHAHETAAHRRRPLTQGDTTCSDHAESHGARAAAPPDASHDAEARPSLARAATRPLGLDRRRTAPCSCGCC